MTRVCRLPTFHADLILQNENTYTVIRQHEPTLIPLTSMYFTICVSTLAKDGTDQAGLAGLTWSSAWKLAKAPYMLGVAEQINHPRNPPLLKNPSIRWSVTSIIE